MSDSDSDSDTDEPHTTDDPTTQQVERIIRDLVHWNITCREAAESLTQTILSEVPDLHVKDALETPLCKAWGVVVASVLRFPKGIPRLAAMMKYIARLPPLLCCELGEEEHAAAVQRAKEKEAGDGERRSRSPSVEVLAEKRVLWPQRRESSGVVVFQDEESCEEKAGHEKEGGHQEKYGDSDHKHETTDPRQVYCVEGKVWQSVPMFGTAVRKMWDLGFIHTHDEGLETEGAHVFFFHINHFCALLHKTGMNVFQYDLFALWSLRDALERNLENERNFLALDQALPRAGLWMAINGQWIYSCDRIWKSSPTKGQPGMGGSLWEGSHGFNKERWSLWRDQLAKIVKLDGIDDMTKLAASLLKERMRQIELVAEAVAEGQVETEEEAEAEAEKEAEREAEMEGKRE